MENAALTPPRKPIRRTPEEWEAIRLRPKPEEAGAKTRAVRLDAAQRLRVRQLYAGGMTAQQIADAFDVGKGTVAHIVREGGRRRFDLGQRAHRRLTSEEREALLAEARETGTHAHFPGSRSGSGRSTSALSW